MLDKTGQTGSPLQLVNGLILISTFACARLGFGCIMVRISFDRHVQWSSHGTYSRQSYQFLQTSLEVRDGLSSTILAGYICGNLALNGLNVFWIVFLFVSVPLFSPFLQ